MLLFSVLFCLNRCKYSLLLINFVQVELFWVENWSYFSRIFSFPHWDC